MFAGTRPGAGGSVPTVPVPALGGKSKLAGRKRSLQQVQERELDEEEEAAMLRDERQSEEAAIGQQQKLAGAKRSRAA